MAEEISLKDMTSDIVKMMTAEIKHEEKQSKVIHEFYSSIRDSMKHKEAINGR